MKDDKKMRNKLAETEENVNAKTEDANEQTKQQRETEKRKVNVNKFLWWIVGNGLLQILIGTLSSRFAFKMPSISIIGVLVFQILFLFVLAECYELNFMKILIDLVIKSKRNM